MGGNIPCGKVQDQRYVTEMIRTIPKEEFAPGIWLPEGNLKQERMPSRDLETNIE